MTRRWTALAVVALLALTVACARKPRLESPEQRESFARVPYEVELDGDVDLTYDRRTELRIFSLTGGAQEVRHLNLLGVKPKVPVEIEGGRFWVLLDIVGYRGDGSYTIRPRPSAAEIAGGEEGLQGLSGGNLSNVVVQYMRDSGEPVEFRPTEPCRVSVSDDGHRGRVTCPSMEAPGDRTVSLRSTWG